VPSSLVLDALIAKGALRDGAARLSIGRDLARVIELARGPLPIEPALAIVAMACASVHAAHGDLSPEHVFVTYRGQVSVLAPRAENRDGDQRGDIFALGVLLWELTTGRRLLAPPTGDEVPADYPPPLVAIVARCLDRDPAARFRSCARLSVALVRFARERKYALSAATVARAMHELFARELVALEAVAHTGVPLPARLVVAAPADDEPTVVDRPVKALVHVPRRVAHAVVAPIANRIVTQRSVRIALVAGAAIALALIIGTSGGREVALAPAAPAPARIRITAQTPVAASSATRARPIVPIADVAPPAPPHPEPRCAAEPRSKRPRKAPPVRKPLRRADTLDTLPL